MTVYKPIGASGPGWPQLCHSRGMKQAPQLGFDDDGRPILITQAALPYEEEHRARVKKYLTIMSFRIPALIAAAVAYSVWENGWVSLLIVAASIPLPWVAVLIANDRPPRRREEPRRFDKESRRIPLFPTAERPALERGSEDGSAPHDPASPPPPGDRNSHMRDF